MYKCKTSKYMTHFKFMCKHSHIIWINFFHILDIGLKVGFKGWSAINIVWGLFSTMNYDKSTIILVVKENDTFWIVSIVCIVYNFEENCIVYEYLNPMTAKFGLLCYCVFFLWIKMNNAFKLVLWNRINIIYKCCKWNSSFQIKGVPIIMLWKAIG